MTDLRSLCARMADELDYYRQLLMDDRRETHALAAEARAALAEEPVADGPTSGAYINRTTRRVFFNNPATIAECGGPCEEGGPEACDCGALWHDEPVADGPAVPEGREPASVVGEPSDTELLEQRHPEPVPVSERLPGPEMCWWWIEPDEDDDDSGYGGSWTLLRIRGNKVSYTHWLPAHALPLPAGEVEP